MIIYVTSVGPYAGKTLTILGLGRILRERGLSFFKTLANRPTQYQGKLTDEDALFLAQALNLDQDPEELFGLLLTQDNLVQALKEGLPQAKDEILRKMAPLKERGLVIASGFGTLYTGQFLSASNLSLAKELGAKVVLVARFEGEFIVDYLLKARDELGDNLTSLVINAIDDTARPLYEDLLRPFLKREGFSILAEIPKDSILQAVSVKELQEFLGGDVIISSREDRLVERFLIGGMQVDKAVTYFKKTPNFGVIVGGDRSDIQLAAIETGAVCLILTGGLYPNEIILSKAEEYDVAVLVVPDDTYSTAQRVERLPMVTRLRHPAKLKRALELTEHFFDQELVKSIF